MPWSSRLENVEINMHSKSKMLLLLHIIIPETIINLYTLNFKSSIKAQMNVVLYVVDAYFLLNFLFWIMNVENKKDRPNKGRKFGNVVTFIDNIAVKNNCYKDNC